jgi:uncharacterized GH25 family protein
MPILYRRLTASLAAILFLAAAGPLLAHDTWLIPARFAVPPGATVRLELTSAMRFPEAETAVAADRLAATGVRLGGRTRPLVVKGEGAKALELSAPLSAAGIAALWVESRPRTLSLGTAEVEEYLDEIGAPATVRARWKPGQRWKETYRKMAKTFVRVGEPGTDRSWAEPVGMELEIVAEEDPTAVRAGSPLPLRVLRGGKGLAGFSVGAAGAGRSSMRTTDADGRVSLTLDEAGPWLIKGTLLEESRATDTDWESLFTTLTVSVRPAR